MCIIVQVIISDNLSHCQTTQTQPAGTDSNIFYHYTDVFCTVAHFIDCKHLLEEKTVCL